MNHSVFSRIWDFFFSLLFLGYKDEWRIILLVLSRVGKMIQFKDSSILIGDSKYISFKKLQHL